MGSVSALSALTNRRFVAYALAGLLAATGLMHFVATRALEDIVPPQLGNPRFWVYASGIAELGIALLIAVPRSRRIGALACVALLVAVFPANIYAALHNGYQSLQPPFNSTTVAVARLPLQAVLVWWAWRVAHHHSQVDARHG